MYDIRGEIFRILSDPQATREGPGASSVSLPVSLKKGCRDFKVLPYSPKMTAKIGRNAFFQAPK
jgi:hypothetical protein